MIMQITERQSISPKTDSSIKAVKKEQESLSAPQSPVSASRSSPFSSNQLQRKIADTQIGRFSFQKLLEPSLPQHAGISPFRVVLGHVKDKVRSFLLTSKLVFLIEFIHSVIKNTSISWRYICGTFFLQSNFFH